MPLLLSRADVEQVLRMDDCIEALRPAHIAFSRGDAIMPLRLTERFHDHGVMALMPAWLDDGPLLGVKCVTSFFANPERGLPMIASTILLLDAETGGTQAIMDGALVTEIRTAAASALATAELARPEAAHLALIGAGVQGRSHLEAMAAVRALKSVSVVARSAQSADRFIERHAEHHPGVEFRTAASGDDAVQSADLVCAVSAAHEPVFSPATVAPGTHINGVGSHTPNAREIPGETMRDARVIVDSRVANLSECGDCMIPIAAGLFGPEHVSDELGEVLAGTRPGRTTDGEITVYQSCGIAIQDVATANLVYKRARAAEVGVDIDL
jgi:ornithine cyclodeaminase/alanine dehydrogenase-like protein (mu-crystallin family)